MKSILATKMFWILLPILLFLLFRIEGIGSWDVNRTISWGWDPIAFFRWSSMTAKSSMMLFTIGYGIISVYNKRTNISLSILHLLLIFIFLWIPWYCYMISILIGFLTWIVFTLNFIFAIRAST